MKTPDLRGYLLAVVISIFALRCSVHDVATSIHHAADKCHPNPGGAS